jgi:hypothetical protein
VHALNRCSRFHLLGRKMKLSFYFLNRYWLEQEVELTEDWMAGSQEFEPAARFLNLK